MTLIAYANTKLIKRVALCLLVCGAYFLVSLTPWKRSDSVTRPTRVPESRFDETPEVQHLRALGQVEVSEADIQRL